MLKGVGSLLIIAGLLAMLVGSTPLFEKWTMLEQYAPAARGLTDATYANQRRMEADRNGIIVLWGVTGLLAGLIMVMAGAVMGGRREQPPADNG